MKRFHKPNVVISKCIEFENCRYDGSKINSDIVKDLKNYFNFYPICPEMEIGLPSPRQALRIILDDQGKEQLIFSKTGEQITSLMEEYLTKQIKDLKDLKIDGFLLKSRSPSCGMKDVKLYKTYGKSPSLSKKTKGFFGQAVIDTFGNLPIEDEGRLTNYHIREHFYTRLYINSAFRALKEQPSMKEFIQFHSINKYLFMAYHPNHLKALGRIVANHKQKPLSELLIEYEEVLYKLLRLSPKPMRFVNVMLHIFGYFSKELNANEKAYFLDTIEQYTQHQVPQSTVMAILKSWVLRFDNEYLAEQTIFESFPRELIQVTDSGKGIE